MGDRATECDGTFACDGPWPPAPPLAGSCRTRGGPRGAAAAARPASAQVEFTFVRGQSNAATNASRFSDLNPSICNDPNPPNPDLPPLSFSSVCSSSRAGETGRLGDGIGERVVQRVAHDHGHGGERQAAGLGTDRDGARERLDQRRVRRQRPLEPHDRRRRSGRRRHASSSRLHRAAPTSRSR